MYAVSLSVTLVIVSVVSASRRQIDRNDCREMSASFGHYIACPTGYVGVGLCASGGNKDCHGQSHRLKCCKVIVTSSGQKEENTKDADYGHRLYCPSGMTIHGFCSSGRYRDCQNFSHHLTCSKGHGLAIDTNQDNCVWLNANWGKTVSCPNRMVGTGFCAGGRNRDCPDESSHGIYCCPLAC